MSVPIITHSEITGTIYIVCGTKKYNVTEQVIKAMRETGRLEQQRSRGAWIEHRQFLSMGYFFSEYECSNCHDDVWQKTEWQFCPSCGASMIKKEGEQNE